MNDESDGEGSPDLGATVDNLRTPMPLRRKVGLFARNTLKKLRDRSTCCGHDGEPGC